GGRRVLRCLGRLMALMWLRTSATTAGGSGNRATTEGRGSGKQQWRCCTGLGCDHISQMESRKKQRRQGWQGWAAATVGKTMARLGSDGEVGSDEGCCRGGRLLGVSSTRLGNG
ncbi:hypothetical protein GW17_00040026, partial [Ensete ventricosum]